MSKSDGGVPLLEENGGCVPVVGCGCSVLPILALVAVLSVIAVIVVF